MRSKLYSLFALLLWLCSSGAWATEVIVIQSTSDATTYGSLSGTTFTTNSASGMAGVTVDGIIGTTATTFAYGACLALTSTSSGTITITAPTGYVITDYSVTGRSNTYAVPYTLTPTEGGSTVATTTSGVTLSATGLSTQSTSFTYSASSANSWYIPSMTITIMSATASTVNVTYNLYDAAAPSTLLATATATQEANSAISIPSAITSLCNSTYYTTTTSGTIGSSDCTVSVTRTLNDPYRYLSQLSNNKSYYLRSLERGALSTYKPSDSDTTFLASPIKTALGVSAKKFAILSYESNYYLYSVEDASFATFPGTNNECVPFATCITGTSDRIGFNETTLPLYQPRFNDSSSYIINSSSAYTYGLVVNSWGSWSSSLDGGCQYTIEEAETFDPTDALAILDNFFHPAQVSYTVDLGGLTTASITVGGTTYHDGETFTKSEISANDVTVTLPSGYTLISTTISGDSDERTVVVRCYLDLSSKTRITDLSALSATKGYVLNNYYNEGAGTGVMVADGNEVTLRNLRASSHDITNDVFQAPYLPANKSHVWQLLTESGNYYLYNPGVEKFLCWSGSYYTLTASKTTIDVTPLTDENEDVFAFGFKYTGGESYKYACAATQFSTSPIRWWYSTDADSQWEIMEADFSSLSTRRTYVIDVTGLDDCSEYDADNEYSLGTETYYWSDGDEQLADILLEASDVTVPEYAGYTVVVTIEGNVIHITYSNVADLTALENAVETLSEYVNLVGTGVGHYTVSGSTLTDLAADLATAQGYLEAESVAYSQQSVVDALAETLLGYVGSFELNVPETGKYYRLKGCGSGHYLCAGAAGTSALNELSSEADATNIFYLDTDNKLLSYYNPTYLTGTYGNYYATYLNNPGTTDGFNLIFHESAYTGTETGYEAPYVGAYGIAVNDTLYLYDWSFTWNGTQLLTQNDPGDIRCQWYIEEVEELPLTLNEVNDYTYATMFLPVAVQLTGATAYLPTLTGDVITLTEISDGIVPANTAVILRGTATTATASITTTTKTLSSALTGTIYNLYAADVATPYVFSYSNGVLGFFRYVGEVLTGNKVYYSSSADVTGFAIDWDNLVDGLGTVGTSETGHALYDLSGRRMADGNHPKGLYIRDGKKYLVK